MEYIDFISSFTELNSGHSLTDLKKPKVKTSSKSKESLVYVSLHGFNLEFWKKKEHRDQGKRPLLFVTLDQVS